MARRLPVGLAQRLDRWTLEAYNPVVVRRNL